MSSLSDKLKALGVAVDQVPQRQQPASQVPLERTIAGRFVETASRRVYLVEESYPIDHQHGRAWLRTPPALHTIAEWAGEPRFAQVNGASFAYLDAETTGLARGAGTYAFLIGLGTYVGETFQVTQLFMPDPSQEPALLSTLETLLAPCSTIVTFNGKTFDLPLLKTRYVANGRDCPFADLPHLDLLSLARRLWRSRLPSRALGHLEQEVLSVHRETSDVPGWMIPELYFDYLRDGDARPLAGVFYHNAVDLLSMAALLNHAALLLADPLGKEDVHPLDLADMGRLFGDLEHVETAAALYERAEAADLPPDARQQIVRQWSFLEKRRGNLEAAMRLWHAAAAAGQVYAHVELAKVYEHHTRNLQGAIFWTQLALDRIAEPDYPQHERTRWADELAHRLARLHRLASVNGGCDVPEPDCGSVGP